MKIKIASIQKDEKCLKWEEKVLKFGEEVFKFVQVGNVEITSSGDR